MVKPVYLVSEPICRRLLACGAACLYGFLTYLMETVGQGCSQFIRFLDLFRNVLYSKSCLYFSKNLFLPFVSIIGISNWFKYHISKPTSKGLLPRGGTWVYGFPTYLPGTVCWEATCIYCLQIYLQGIVCLGCSLFPNLPACKYSFQSYLQGTSVQCAACLYSFKTYLTGTVGWGCSHFLNIFRNVSYSKTCLDFCHL